LPWTGWPATEDRQVAVYGQRRPVRTSGNVEAGRPDQRGEVGRLQGESALERRGQIGDEGELAFRMKREAGERAIKGRCHPLQGLAPGVEGELRAPDLTCIGRGKADLPGESKRAIRTGVEVR
jgi:hypothetical protein